MSDEWCTGNHYEGGSNGLIKAPSQQLPGGTKETIKHLSQDSWCAYQDLNEHLLKQVKSVTSRPTCLTEGACPVLWIIL
jgi:hypothetical protein